MAKRPGMAALAEAAGVSVATVDRLLNGRESVSAATRAAVLEAAQRMGHPAALRLMQGGAAIEVPLIRYGVLLLSVLASLAVAPKAGEKAEP